MEDSSKLAEIYSQYAATPITADISHLAESEKRALSLIIEAAKLLDPIFDLQAWRRNLQVMQEISELGKEDENHPMAMVLELYKMFRGPWNHQDEGKPFFRDYKRPIGAGFYPEDMTAAEFNAWVNDESHTDDREAFESEFTVISRSDDGGLVAIPYSQEYAKYLVPAANFLREAANETRNASLKKFLNLRAESFLSNEYYESESAWIDLDSDIEVVIGPIEVYEDTLFNKKSAFEAFVTVSDPNASKSLQKFTAFLTEMEQGLPVPDEMKTVRGGSSPIKVVDLVYSSGDARKNVQTIAFNLPNNEKLRAEKGAKKVLMRNIIKAKFDQIMGPIGKCLFAPETSDLLCREAFFQLTLFHELSHSLGPAYILGDVEKKQEIRSVFGSMYSALEECKADILGCWNLMKMVERGEFSGVLTISQVICSWFAGLFRSIRFGANEAHGQGALIQINRMLNAPGSVSIDAKSGMMNVDVEIGRQVVKQLSHDIIVIQFNGDLEAGKQLLETDGKMNDAISSIMKLLEAPNVDIPIDIRPLYQPNLK